MRNKLVLLCLLLSFSGLAAQESKFGPFIGVGYSWFTSHNDDVNDIYGSFVGDVSFVTGLGYGNFYGVFKFTQFTRTGSANVSHSELTSKASFQQDLMFFGGRLYLGDDRDARVYVELGAVYSDVTEAIEIEELPNNELNGVNMINDWGVQACAGIEFNITSFLSVFSDISTSWIKKDVESVDMGGNDTGLNLGGINIQVGIIARPF